MVSRTPLLAAIRGPVILITVGVLFAIDYSTGVSFGKTWPILLIVVGILHLIGRARAGRVGSEHVNSGNTAEGHVEVGRIEEPRP